MKKFIITFGFAHKDTKGQTLRHCYTIIEANNKEDAREIMFAHPLKSQWSSIYDSEAEAGVIKYNLSYVPFKSL